jgi:hypothetical protein
MKAVVLGAQNANYTNSISQGLRFNGLDVSEFTYIDPPRTAVEALFWRTLPKRGFSHFANRELGRCLHRVRAACKQSDLLVVLKGDRIPIEMLADLVHEIPCPMVTWFMDSLDHVKNAIERAKLSSHLLYFDGSDGPALEAEGIHALKVDLAYDPRWYYPCKERPRLYDVTFVGTLWPNRLDALEQVCAGLAGRRLNARVWGNYIPKMRPWKAYTRFQRFYPNLSTAIRQKSFSEHHEINLLNNQSRIALNILHPMSKDSLNMRAFESCGSGAFQLIQTNPAVARCFKPGLEIETFDSIEEAVDKIGFYAKSDSSRDKIAQAGFRRASVCHTMPTRVRQILNYLAKHNVIKFN